MIENSLKFSHFLENAIKKSAEAKLRLAPQRRRITLSSIHIRARYALRVTLVPARSAFKLFAASAERKCIFEDQKSMNPEVFG